MRFRACLMSTVPSASRGIGLLAGISRHLTLSNSEAARPCGRSASPIGVKAKSEVRAKEPKRITVPKYLPQVMEAEYRLTAKKLVALHIFSDLDYDMLARYFFARAAW